MTYEGILATFGELFLKGRNRHRFIDEVMRCIRKRLDRFANVTCDRTHANAIISLHGTPPEPVLRELSFIFGLQSFQLFIRCASEMEALKAGALKVARELEREGVSVKVSAKRSDKRFPVISPQIASQVGNYVADNCDVRIDMHAPDVMIKLVVQRGGSFIVSREIPGPGGLPIGLNGSTLLMLSGGLDSPVAGYLMMKRGVGVEALHFDSPPFTSPRARQKVLDLAEKLAHYMPQGRIRVHIVPFTNLQKAIFEGVPENYAMTIMRRMMYRIAAGLAERCGCVLLSNGESLGQVASQTPHSMQAINAVTSLPVIRPVACMDKQEIISIARRIETHDISIRPYEDCCTVFVPKSPATSPKQQRCENYEKAFAWQELLEACIEGTSVTSVEAGHPIRIDQETSDAICSLL